MEEEDDETLSKDPSLPLRELSREEWNAPPVPENLPPEEYLTHPIPEVIFSFTQTPYCHSVEDCKKEMLKLYEDAKDKGLYDIPYNFVVGGDGTVFEGRGWKRRPENHELFSGLRDRSIEISHFGERVNPPNFDQINGSWDIVLKGIKEKYMVPLPKRHSHFYLNW